MPAGNDAELIKKLRRQAKQADVERAKSEALFSSLREGLVVIDEHGIIIRINEAALDILGYKRATLRGKWFPEAIQAVKEDGSAIDNIDRPVAKVFLTGEAISERTFYKRRDGTVLPVHVSVAPVLLRGKPIGAIQIFRDISFDMRMDSVKTDFMSIASHQLRTPLSAINTYSHMLAEGYAGDLNGTQTSFLVIIMSAVLRMNNLINTLLNVTRIEAGNINVTPKPVQLRQLAQEIVIELKGEAREHGVSLKLTAADIPTVSTDSILVKEVFSNLVSNAIKYTPKGGEVNVVLRTKGNSVLFTIRDTGYGIPHSAQRYIFTKFFRAENVVSKEVGGTGLGLYLTKIIVENLSGQLWFESQEGRGTTFYFSLPIKGSPKKAGRFKLEAKTQQYPNPNI